MISILRDYLNNHKYRSAGLTFFLMSLMFALWIIRLPEIRSALALSEGQIGMALFFIPVGALMAMSVSHILNKKIGEGRLMSIALFLTAVTALFPVLANSFPLFCAGLMFFGFANGLTDISMNSLVSTFEKKDKVRIMSVSHGFFSLGGILGPLLGSLFFEVSALGQVGTAAVMVVLLIIFVIYPSVGKERDHDHSTQRDPVFAIPRGMLIPLALISFCAMMSEGAIADWSAIYLDDVVQAPSDMLGLGYAAFSTTMTLGRFYGDRLTGRLGRRNVIIYGCLLAMVGIGLVLTGDFATVLIGFTIVGIGFSALIPVLFSIAGSVPGISSSFGIASVGGAGYTGFLLGPVVLGFLAEYQGLQVSFILLIVLSIVSLFTALRSL